MTVRVLWTVEDWASAIADLPVAPGLPDRAVFVPNERVAHALRRTLIESGLPSALVGTRFLTLLQFARELLLEAGETLLASERELGATLVREVFQGVTFERFHREDLLALPGWDDAFLAALTEVESALLTPDDLLAHSDAQVVDVGRVHAMLRKQAELATAAALLQRAAALAPTNTARGSMLVVVTGFESPAEVQLLRALPGLIWAQWAVRPLRTDHTQRTALLLGAEFASGLRETQFARAPSGALHHLQVRMFAEHMFTAAPQDDSVRVAIYAGVHEEVEAAVSWVTEQIVEHGVPAQEIAILSPVAEPYGSLLRARLAVLPWHDGREPTFSEGGVPLTERSDGARLLLAIRALRQGLSRDALAPLLPVLRTSGQAWGIRGLSRAWQLLNTVAAIGGERAHLAAGCDWGEAWRRAGVRLETAPLGPGGLEDRERTQRAELQRDLTALVPAIDALVDVLRAVIEDAPLSQLWTRVSELAQSHLKLPHATPPAVALLGHALSLFAGHAPREPTGDDALAWLETMLLQSVVKVGRFGTPAIYLGTLAGVRGLAFRAVRLIGLIEGAVPSAVREDPVLPDAARAALSPFLLTSRQRAHRQVAAFDDAVRAARERLALSAPRVSLEGSTRQPAAVLLDVMRVLSGANEDLEDQLEDAARAGRAAERDVRQRLPVSASARLDRVARGDLMFARVELNPALALDALRAIRDRQAPSAQDGLLGGVLALEQLAGLSLEKPISASRLATLLSCPHQYLFENVLGFREEDGPLHTHSLHVMTFGIWLHGIAEEFWREHGARIGTRDGELEQYRAQLRALAFDRFEVLRQTYPFANSHVAHAEREALCDQLEKLLALDWNDGRPRAFVDVERGFGYDEPCSVETQAGPLHLRGKIDKLDREGNTLLVRDIKTGAGKPRRADGEPELSIDLQLGVYARVAQQMAHRWGTPVDVGVAYVYLRSGEPERSWKGADYARLDDAARDWLATARDTLVQGAFVRSPNTDDCFFCPYKPVCAPEMHRAARVLGDPRVPRRLAVLKLGEDA